MNSIARWFSNPQITDPVEKRNFINVQIDAIGVGLASASAPFLPVFLTLLGATNFQVGLLTSMPAVTGFLLAIPLGQFLQRQARVVPWFSLSRLLVVACYALTGLAIFFVPPEFQVASILGIWALATLPQTMVSICFSVVMNAVAGPKRRFDLMSRRWSILGFTTAIVVISIGQILDLIPFPINFQAVFMALSVGGLISYRYSSNINIPPADNGCHERVSLLEQYKSYLRIIRTEKPFLSFVMKRFVFLSGATLAAPLFPLFYVREVHASNSWIAAISTTHTAVMILGYFLWTRQSRAKGSRPVLLWATLGLSLYPILTALTLDVRIIALVAGLAGIFQAGADLVFFDELMNTVPPQYSATFVSFAQSLQFLSAIVAPLIGSVLADTIGIGAGLMIAGGVRFIGFLLFFFSKPVQKYAGL